MTGRRWSRARARARAFGVASTGVGVALQQAPAETPGRVYWPWPLLAGVLVLALLFAGWQRRHGGSAGLVGRWSRRGRRNSGVASRWQIIATSSCWPVRWKASVLRPALRDAGRLTRMTVRTRELATPIARVGWLRIWSPIEDVTVAVGGPRTGKSGALAGRILDAPGAVIATSTRTDLVELTGPLRARVGPVHVFNPAGVGGLPSTITFDPLSGCERPKTATTRAADLLSGAAAPGAAGGGDREFWAGQARRVLACLLHAAALGGADMREVLAWVADPDDAAADVTRFLRRSPEPAFESDAAQFLGTNPRTQSSICATIMPALGWLTDETAAAAAGAGRDSIRTPDGVGGFDVAALIESRGTVYMLGAEDAQTAPLVCALTGHIAREARALAGLMTGGRLDPPLTLALDEAGLVAPVPLDNWTADMGGRNVQMHLMFQSRAQMRARWGEVGAAAILNNAATVMIFGGTRDPDDLNAWSTLCGERDEDVPTHDADGQVTALGQRRVPVLSPSQIAQLPARRVVIIRRGMPPAVGRVQMAWKRHDVRAARREERRAVQGARLHVIATRIRARGRKLTGRRDAIEPQPAADALAVGPGLDGDGLVEVDRPRDRHTDTEGRELP